MKDKKRGLKPIIAKTSYVTNSYDFELTFDQKMIFPQEIED